MTKTQFDKMVAAIRAKYAQDILLAVRDDKMVKARSLQLALVGAEALADSLAPLFQEDDE